MIIYVSRGGQKIAASVLYNFSQVCNVVVLRLHRTFLSDEDELVLIYDFKKKKWGEVFHLEERDPLLFREILTKLRDVLSEAESSIPATGITTKHSYDA